MEHTAIEQPLFEVDVTSCVCCVQRKTSYSIKCQKWRCFFLCFTFNFVRSSGSSFPVHQLPSGKVPFRIDRSYWSINMLGRLFIDVTNLISWWDLSYLTLAKDFLEIKLVLLEWRMQYIFYHVSRDNLVWMWQFHISRGFVFMHLCCHRAGGTYS